MALLLACLALACLLFAAPSMAAEGTVHYQKESFQEYEKQLAGSEILEATFNKRVRSIHLNLKDGRHVLVHYGKGEEPKLLTQLQSKGVPVTIEKPAQAAAEAKKIPVHHKLRYIVGGIVIAIVIIVGAVLLIDRRRKRARE
jgi:Skp family chaperone for outer membrane proteins